MDRRLMRGCGRNSKPVRSKKFIYDLPHKEYKDIEDMLNMKSSVSTIWVYPYFMERQVRSSNPDLVMSDYRITYADHVQYGDTDQARKQGSPVRSVFYFSVAIAT